MVRTRLRQDDPDKPYGPGGRVAEALWGGTKKLRPNQEASLFRWLEEDSDETWTMTVAVGPVYNPPSNPAQSIDLVGTVRWGNGAGSLEAEFDIKLGVQFCVNASFIEVSVKYNAGKAPRPPPTFAAPIPVPVPIPIPVPVHNERVITVQGFLTPGTPPPQAGLTRTLTVVVPASDDALIVVPRFARSVRFYSTDLGVDAFGQPVPASWTSSVEYRQIDEAVLTGNEIASFPGNIFAFGTANDIKLINNARGIKIINTAIGEVPITALFDLEL